MQRQNWFKNKDCYIIYHFESWLHCILSDKILLNTEFWSKCLSVKTIEKKFNLLHEEMKLIFLDQPFHVGTLKA